jgi:L-aminopeptidase/D-esterase-like protein
VHGVLLTGGSAFGLAAADGVMTWLEQHGRGWPVGGGQVVPIVPAAVLFDLGRGGDARARPDAALGREAAAAASASAVPQGCVGAGTGAVAGGLKGGIGSGSTVLSSGAVVGALVAVNSAGSVLDPRTGELWGERHLLDHERLDVRPDPAALRRHLDRIAAMRVALQAARATTLVVLATDLTLDKAQCTALAGQAHDGMARAISPVHTMVDGDTAFALSTRRRPVPDRWAMHELLAAAADVVTRAVVHAVLRAASTTTDAGSWPSYRDELLGGAQA